MSPLAERPPAAEERPRPLTGRVSARLHPPAALVAGAALATAFEPFGLSPLAVLAPALLFALWLGAPGARAAAWQGWLFGVGLFGVGVSWVLESFGHVNVALPAALLLTVLFVLFLALFPAAVGWLAVLLRGPRTALWCALVVPSAWTLGEWARGTFLTGFTWLQLGYSQIDAPLAGLAPLGGVYATSAAVAVSAGLVVWAAHAAWATQGSWARSAGALAAAALLWAGAGALKGIEWTEPAGRPLRTALIQGNVPQSLKWRPEMRATTLNRYLELTRAQISGEASADLVVWPETALPGAYHAFADFIDALEAEARARATEILAGVPAVEQATGRVYNSIVSIGSRRAFYHKRHLVPFGEYLPLEPLLAPIAELLGAPVASFSRGDADQAPLEVAGHRIGASVCYEAAFGAEVARALPEAALLVNVSNDAWFGDSLAPHQHLEIARLRALETGRYLLRATNTGISAVIGPRGELVARSPQFEVATVVAVVLPMRGATPYVRAGDAPAIAAAALVLALAGVRRWLRRAGRLGRSSEGG